MHRPSRHKEIILYYFFHHRLQPLVTNKRPICSESPDYQGHHSQGRNAPLGTTSRHRTTTLTRATAAQQGYIRIQFSSQLQSTTRGPRQPVAQSFEKCNCVCPVLNTDLKPTVLIGKSLSCILYRDKKSQRSTGPWPDPFYLAIVSSIPPPNTGAPVEQESSPAYTQDRRIYPRLRIPHPHPETPPLPAGPSRIRRHLQVTLLIATTVTSSSSPLPPTTYVIGATSHQPARPSGSPHSKSPSQLGRNKLRDTPPSP
jgi:hypothetical protein